MKKWTLYTKIIVNLIITVLLIVLLVVFVPRLIGFFLPFVIGWIIAMIANPLVKILEKKLKIVRKWSSVVIIVMVLGGVTVGMYFLLSALFVQTKNFIGDLPDNYSKIEMTLQSFAVDLQENYTFLPEKLVDSVSNFILELDVHLSESMKGFEFPSLGNASDIVKSVADGMFIFIITVISSYFFIAEKDHIMERFKEALPESVVEYWNMIANNFKHAVGGYFKAQLKIMVIIIGILLVGFVILNVKYAILLAILIAVLDFLPVFGTGTVIWPWAVIDVVTGHYSTAIGLMVLYLICQIMKQILQPKMVGDSIGLSPLMTLIFLYTGYKIGGILGMIIGIPVGMIILSLYKAGAFDRLLRGAKILINDINEFRKY